MMMMMMVAMAMMMMMPPGICQRPPSRCHMLMSMMHVRPTTYILQLQFQRVRAMHQHVT
jgi:hypothetical protein